MKFDFNTIIMLQRKRNETIFQLWYSYMANPTNGTQETHMTEACWPLMDE